MTEQDNCRLATFHRRIMQVFWANKISSATPLQTKGQETLDIILWQRRWKWLGHMLPMDVTVRAYKNSPDLDSRGMKEKGVIWDNMGENDTGRDEESWYWMGESHKISPRQSG